MRLSHALSISYDLWLAATHAVIPTLRAVFHDPRSISNLSRIFFAHVWEAFGSHVDANGNETKQGLLVPYAEGIVLDLGAGHGHTVNYLDHARTTRYIALEPNTLMHKYIRVKANEAGYHEADGTLLILSCGAQDTEHILSAIGSPVDTLVSILTLCTVPDPQNTIRALVDQVLKPGGQLLYYEHVLSHRKDVAWWQRFWAPVWAAAFDGCKIDRPTHVWIDKAASWRESRVWGKPGEQEENLFYHSVGRYVKDR